MGRIMRQSSRKAGHHSGMNHQPHLSLEPKLMVPSEVAEFVTFIIGPATASKIFLVHKEFVYHHSPVLKTAFESSFIEGETQIYKLDDVTPATFTLFVQWLYTQNLCNPITPPGDVSSLIEHWHSLLRLWVLADKMMVPRLQNMTINAIENFRKSTLTLPSDEFAYVYENTDTGSQLRRILVEQCVRFLEKDVLRDLNFLKALPRDMLLDITCSLEYVSPTWTDYSLQISDYHV
jgi:hypothetical protein